jgi:vancomycin resistance protein VanW
LRISNQTDEAYQICLRIEDHDLVGEIRTDSTPYLKYRVYEQENKIAHEYWGRYIRHNLIRRQLFDLEDNLVGDEYVCENHALMMYEPLISGEVLKAGTRGI